MGSGLEESPKPFATSSTKTEEPDNITNDAVDFECNICFDLAHDPVVTLCGHLYCWPCLYKWLHYHSQSHKCPVCNALVQEDKLVPLFGQGKFNSDPRTRPISGLDIPSRPSGQRPHTAPPPPGSDQVYNFPNFGFGLFGGFMPMTNARVGNLTMSAGFGGLFPAMLSFQFSGFPDSTMFGAPHGHGFPQPVHGHGVYHGHGHGHGFQHYQQGLSQRQDVLLKNLLMIVGLLVLVSFIFT